MPRFAPLAALSFALIAAAPATDWSQIARPTAKGAYVFGNPAARVKLIEYGSYTCSHCADFANESAPVLKGQMIRSGKVSLEYRHLIRDPADLGAAILARCAGPRGFGAAHAMVFATQKTWLPKVAAYAEAHPDVATKPLVVQARAFADAGGLTAAMRARGLSLPQVNACFADKAGVDRITAMTGDAPIEVNSTPTFYLDGVLQPAGGWSTLEPVLRAKGAR
ncbi:DsbA family protein [Sphingomonas sp. RP10(2022)]|uniref:DsbA family protein n=1 Tax=Sphingomonas liriopis TaxID=2949094 RepID=A0A9X2HU57_9SPHN|nr:thioredoxin domain-containing protein [Sphingomonas liriopis]MCP3735554.1 DsbA family protein [Sphingomonas liriopis]